jgi:hypothetical protein
MGDKRHKLSPQTKRLALHMVLVALVAVLFVFFRNVERYGWPF